MKVNIVYNENCLDTMARMPDEYVDLVITSPPYKNLRTFGIDVDNEFRYQFVVDSLYRVMKEGGVVVWVVSDTINKYNESGDSFRHALYFKEVGFNLFDTMIWQKYRKPIGSNLAYYNTFEYMFVFSKGKPKSINLLNDYKNKGWVTHCYKKRDKNGNIVKERYDGPQYEYGRRGNVWFYDQTTNRQTKDWKLISGHPATFPEKLAQDHILSWSNEGDVVYDPMAGSGTVLKMALLNNRKYIGSELNPDYVKIINERLSRCGGLSP